MPLDKFILLIVIVLAAAGATVWVAATIAAVFGTQFGLITLIPVGLVAYVAWRVIAERLNSKEDDYYDSIDK